MFSRVFSRPLFLKRPSSDSSTKPHTSTASSRDVSPERPILSNVLQQSPRVLCLENHVRKTSVAGTISSVHSSSNTNDENEAPAGLVQATIGAKDSLKLQPATSGIFVRDVDVDPEAIGDDLMSNATSSSMLVSPSETATKPWESDTDEEEFQTPSLGVTTENTEHADNYDQEETNSLQELEDVPIPFQKIPSSDGESPAPCATKSVAEVPKDPLQAPHIMIAPPLPAEPSQFIGPFKPPRTEDEGKSGSDEKHIEDQEERPPLDIDVLDEQQHVIDVRQEVNYEHMLAPTEEQKPASSLSFSSFGSSFAASQGESAPLKASPSFVSSIVSSDSQILPDREPSSAISRNSFHSLSVTSDSEGPESSLRSPSLILPPSQSLAVSLEGDRTNIHIGETAIEPAGIPLPSTYAEATNLAHRFPEISDQILQLPLYPADKGPVIPMHTFASPQSRKPRSGANATQDGDQLSGVLNISKEPSTILPTPNLSPAPSIQALGVVHTAERPNWALAPDEPVTSPQRRSHKERCAARTGASIRRGDGGAPSMMAPSISTSDMTSTGSIAGGSVSKHVGSNILTSKQKSPTPDAKVMNTIIKDAQSGDAIPNASPVMPLRAGPSRGGHGPRWKLNPRAPSFHAPRRAQSQLNIRSAAVPSASALFTLTQAAPLCAPAPQVAFPQVVPQQFALLQDLPQQFSLVPQQSGLSQVDHQRCAPPQIPQQFAPQIAFPDALPQASAPHSTARAPRPQAAPQTTFSQVASRIVSRHPLSQVISQQSASKVIPQVALPQVASQQPAASQVPHAPTAPTESALLELMPRAQVHPIHQLPFVPPQVVPQPPKVPPPPLPKGPPPQTAPAPAAEVLSKVSSQVPTLPDINALMELVRKAGITVQEQSPSSESTARNTLVDNAPRKDMKSDSLSALAWYVDDQGTLRRRLSPVEIPAATSPYTSSSSAVTPNFNFAGGPAVGHAHRPQQFRDGVSPGFVKDMNVQTQVQSGAPLYETGPIRAGAPRAQQVGPFPRSATQISLPPSHTGKQGFPPPPQKKADLFDPTGVIPEERIRLPSAPAVTGKASFNGASVERVVPEFDRIVYDKCGWTTLG
ncbi:hypothetical protein A0H81_03912 [Grifola frondosa]|uniref:Uncharacterized protein n=1 Tax=Grifola frondosa TaxID=5627 RepID=A0A1C7MGQ5_GRIFR|nr:hypothetical protein A0H81_03912 [Grifola frondosa]